MRVRCPMRVLALAAVVLVGTVGSARAADKWFVLGHTTLKSTDASAEINAKKGKFKKEDVKKVKLSVEGGDVEISQVVLHWNNRPDDTISNVGVVKSGGETAPKDAPGRETALKGVTVQYKILNGAPSATLKVWGFD